MSDSGLQRRQQARNTIQRVVEVARQGQARLNAYRQETVALSGWLRSYLLRQASKARLTRVGRSLWGGLMVRHLRQRQEVYRNGGGTSSAAAFALQRAEQATRRKKA